MRAVSPQARVLSYIMIQLCPANRCVLTPIVCIDRTKFSKNLLAPLIYDEVRVSFRFVFAAMFRVPLVV